MSMATSVESRTLVAGGIAAILASSCCLGPLLLVALGFSGAWIGNLTRLEPYRPWFLGIALLCLALAARRIFGKAANQNSLPLAVSPNGQCAPGAACASPKSKNFQKIIFIVVCLLVAVAFVFPYFARFFY